MFQTNWTWNRWSRTRNKIHPSSNSDLNGIICSGLWKYSEKIPTKWARIPHRASNWDIIDATETFDTVLRWWTIVVSATKVSNLLTSAASEAKIIEGHDRLFVFFGHLSMMHRLCRFTLRRQCLLFVQGITLGPLHSDGNWQMPEINALK